MGIQMGIGALGFSNTIFKKKFRFTFEVLGICGNANYGVPASYIKTAARPNLAIDETEINFLNSKMFIPGKATWETITVTYIDAVDVNNPQITKPLFDWLSSVYSFHVPNTNLAKMGSRLRDYSATGVIGMYDGCGTLLETWQLQKMWPTNINFGELDYSSSEESTIELTLRYSEVIYTPVCPNFTITNCCSPCGS
jgi:hypothetical protein